MKSFIKLLYHKDKNIYNFICELLVIDIRAT